MNRNLLETVMGAVVIVVAVIFLVFAYHSAEIRSVSGYPLTAKFDHIDGVHEGADVRMSGIKVGSITSTTLDTKTFQAIVKLSIDNSIKLPVDTVATVTQNGLLGDQYMSLVPGNSDKPVRRRSRLYPVGAQPDVAVRPSRVQHERRRQAGGRQWRGPPAQVMPAIPARSAG